jgi:hypothetical protein
MEMQTETPTRSVAALAGARLPADHGLSSLGLVMQLVGGLTFGAMAIFALTPLLGAGRSPMAWPLFLLGASGVVRAVYHRIAGSGLIYGSPKGHLHGVKVYIGVALGETALWVWVFKSQFDMPGKAIFAVALLLVAWPLTLLAVLAWPRLRRYASESLPVPEDMGFEGAAVLMTLFGAVGVLMSGLFLVTILRAGGEVLSTGPGLFFVAILIVLGVRAVFHLMAGVKGTRGLDSDGATEAATRYFNFGVVSSVIVGGALMVVLMMTALHPASLLMCGLVVYFLLVWPLILRRFYMERNFSALLAGQEGPSYRRAPDAGLTALGWLLLASAVYGLASALPQALFGLEGMTGGLGALMSSMGGGGLERELGEAASSTAWWSLGLAGLQLWAGLELIGMTDRHKLAGTIYGGVSALAALYFFWPMLKDLSAVMGPMGGGGMDGLMQFGMVAIQLVVPIGTVILVNRKLTPEAQARFRAGQQG